MLTRVGLLIIGVVFHVIYLYSIFDIYFTSPLVHGMTPHKSPLEAPAERLVLFVADGLRADKIYEPDEQNKSRAPFLRQIMEKQGTWGVSHTRVPTESRPGHVAIIAGFYEDVSAVTTGWSMNPVNFDSVFNQSTHTWSFGSPDILPMFQHGASDPSSVETFMYPPEYEDFQGEASKLDIWVFDHVRELFANASTNADLRESLHRKKVVFFLHLLGLDTNGHGFRPMSKEYLNNINLVDAGIKEMVEIIEEFYDNDGRTSYIFTADHGMNNRGAHGDGHPDNTRTPIIAWGAGIRKPILSGLGHDDFSAEWGLSELQRDDIRQADIAPLMAHLIGADIPVNSVGELPIEYLDGDENAKAEAAFANARQILEQYQVKHDEKQENELFFRPFSKLSGENDPSNVVAEIQKMIDKKDYVGAELKSKQLMGDCLDGLRYFQTYDWLFLRGVVTLGYIGWCVYCLQFVLRHFVLLDKRQNSMSKKSTLFVDISSVLILGVLCSILYIQRMPKTYYGYVVFPVFFWNQNFRNYQYLWETLKMHFRQGPLKFLGTVVIALLFLEALVFSFFYRGIISVIFILLAFWPFVMSNKVRDKSKLLLTGWFISCLCTSIFTLLPVEKGEDITSVVSGGIIGIILGLFSIIRLNQKSRVNRRLLVIMSIQLIIIAFSIILVKSTSDSIHRREGLPPFNQIASWIVIGTSSLFPFVYRGKYDDYMGRLLTICFAFAPLMVLLSISYEMLFYVSFCTTVLIWLEVERTLYKNTQYASGRVLNAGDMRSVLLFLFFIDVAFFGTGNVASLSSFSLESVYRFTTIFDPFLMGSLLLIKVLIPFFIVSAVLSVLTCSVDLPPFTLFLAVMAITDIQTINFFYFVTDYGSWLEIGTSISHFCIAELFIIFTIILFLLSRILVGQLVLPRSKKIVNRMKPKTT
ncbi:Phosphatidylinositolglycan class N-domain-containing protein [Mycotypha africana]|uniref:Phosphatidylinositolglycan class N-domain-containing protein n=1 Tax=Mycotypha africana TaxID=64632 RepID=UPI002300C2B1|nr:Phosphatidylinositolglycan class N-domain-containing protein [Mycotypha africana]KAI8968021.1 Phosphatidylinositolglycan class N-domain-containing protein [Mycotypha africana]